VRRRRRRRRGRNGRGAGAAFLLPPSLLCFLPFPPPQRLDAAVVGRVRRRGVVLSVGPPRYLNLPLGLPGGEGVEFRGELGGAGEQRGDFFARRRGGFSVVGVGVGGSFGSSALCRHRSSSVVSGERRRQQP
jgi:hypothetical protein